MNSANWIFYGVLPVLLAADTGKCTPRGSTLSCHYTSYVGLERGAKSEPGSNLVMLLLLYVICVYESPQTHLVKATGLKISNI